MSGPLSPLDWLGLLHPVLAILFIYPVAGAAIRLGILARKKRTGYNTALPETVPTEHWQHGRWLLRAMVVASLIAYLESFLRHGASGQGWVLFLAGCGTLIALLACTRQPALSRREAPDVVLLTVDTLRHDRLGVTGHAAADTPTIDALGARGVVARTRPAPQVVKHGGVK